jgi:type II secretory pathway component PulJ
VSYYRKITVQSRNGPLLALSISAILTPARADGLADKERTMDKNRLGSAEIHRLKRREAELLARIEKMRQRMNETKDLDTLAFKSKLYKEAQDELRRVHDKLAGRESEE